MRRLRAGTMLAGQQGVRAGLSLVAQDHGGLLGARPLLVLAPHPDDEVLGCGATIARARALGNEVRVVLVSDGSAWPPGGDRSAIAEARLAEMVLACTRLGVEPGAITHLGLPDGELVGHETAVAAGTQPVLDAVDRNRRPVVLATSAEDPHPDHALVGRVARRICADRGIELYEYPIWQWRRPLGWTTALARARPRGHLVKVSTRGFVVAKEAALAAHASQLVPALGGPGPGVIGRDFVSLFLGANEVFVRPELPSPR